MADTLFLREILFAILPGKRSICLVAGYYREVFRIVKLEFKGILFFSDLFSLMVGLYSKSGASNNSVSPTKALYASPKTTRFRPVLLASYNALSARATMESGESSPLISATPALMVTTREMGRGSLGI